MALERDQKTGKKGPLHGMPVSIKENYYIKVLCWPYILLSVYVAFLPYVPLVGCFFIIGGRGGSYIKTVKFEKKILVPMTNLITV